MDVANEAQAKAAAEEAVKRFGRIDVLLNNAGYSLLGNFEELTTSEIDGLISTNLYGVTHVMRAVLPVMRKQRSGQIINIGSLAGVMGFKHCSAYSAAKFAVEGLSQSVALKSDSSASSSRQSRRVSFGQTFLTHKMPDMETVALTTMPRKELRKICGQAMMANSRAIQRNSPMSL